MNEQQVKGTITRAKGSVEAFLGRLTGNRKQQATGVVHKVEGDVRRGVGDVQESVGHRDDKPAAGDRPQAS
jgi:uncharacterized protein YjbJ (UPF0337 family)